MSTYMIVASLLHKKATILSSISFSILVLLVLNPYCILDVGFQLSYTGTIGIVLFSKMFSWTLQKSNFEENEIVKNRNHSYFTKDFNQISQKNQRNVTSSIKCQYNNYSNYAISF